MIGPNVNHSSTAAQTYQFQNMLHTILHLLNITDYMNGANGAADIALLPGVTSAAPNCTPSAPAPSVTICSPTAGATVTSPVNVQAVAASNTVVTKFLVYVDYVLAYQEVNTTAINTNLTMAAGTHNLTVQFYNGAWVKTAENIVVTEP